MMEARPGLYALVDDGLVPPERMPSAVAALVTAGCDLVQLRLKHLDDRQRLDVQREVCAQLPQRPLTLVVNDRADLAAVLLREKPPQVRVGLHLGQTDLSPRLARKVLGPNAADVVVGLSTHNDDEVYRAAVEDVDYLGYGPVRTTTTKAADRLDPVVGLEGLRRAVARASKPVVAIGGLTPTDAAEVHRAGARWMAMAGALWRGDVDLGQLVADVREDFAG